MRNCQHRSAAYLILCILCACLCLCAPQLSAQAESSWTFAVSGDSRNCGDIVMPGIAQGAKNDHAQFYWHLGDFRANYDFDQDMLAGPEYRTKHLTVADYQRLEWPDF